MNDKLWVDVVASRCFTRLQLFDGRFNSSTVKSDDRLVSAVAALESEVTSRDVQRAKSLSASGKRPLFRSCEAIACYWTPRIRRASACQFVYGLPRLAT